MFIFSHNLIVDKIYFMPHSWSLSVEEWFYILIPLFVYILHRKYFISFKKSLLIVVVLIIIITPFLRFFLFESNKFHAVYQRLDQIMYGVLFAWIKFYSPKLYEFNKRFLLLKMILLITSYGLFLLLVVRSHPSLYYNIIFKSIFPFLVGSLIISIEPMDIKVFPRLKRLITNISIYSYSIYLCNMLVTTFFVDYFYQFNFFNTNSGIFILFSLYLCICYFWGKYQYILFEKPVMNLRETVVRKIDSKASVLKGFQNA
jgi:peptidoglycan/LPS O-acetylase OafA/YrhL